MVRKVKTYLEGLKTIDNELELDKMSYELEPQQSSKWTPVSDPFPSQLLVLVEQPAPRRRPSPPNPRGLLLQTSAASSEPNSGWNLPRRSRRCSRWSPPAELKVLSPI